MEEYKCSEALDAGMLAAAQAVEHYEISRYGTLKQWAHQLGMKDAVRLLDQTLQEEKRPMKTDVAGGSRDQPRRRGVITGVWCPAWASGARVRREDRVRCGPGTSGPHFIAMLICMILLPKN